jgi:hypothetical protein
MSAVTQRAQLKIDTVSLELQSKSADIVNLFKPKKEKLDKAIISRSMLQKPTWLPVIRTENLELEEFLDNGIVKLKYRDKEEFELFFNPTFGAPGKFEEKLFYVLLSAVQLQKKKNLKNYRTLYFSSLYAIAGLMGYDRDSSRRSDLLANIELALKKLSTTGVHHKKYYMGLNKQGFRVYGKVFVSSMISSSIIHNIDSGRAHVIKIELNKDYFDTTIDDNATELELKNHINLNSAPALKLYEHLNSYDKTFYNRGWWVVYLDNFLDSLGIKGKFENKSEKLRFLEIAFDNCKPALKFSLEQKIKDTVHFTYWQNKSKKWGKFQDLTLCFYTNRWDPVISTLKNDLDLGFFSDIELPNVLPDAY